MAEGQGGPLAFVPRGGGSMRFVVLTTARTGSTHLVSLLNEHPDIRCHGEIFKRADVPSLEKSLRKWTSESAAERAIGCKLMYYHDTKHRIVWKYIGDHPDVRIVHLVRSNELERYVSDRLVRILGIRHLKRPSTASLRAYRDREAETTFEIDPTDLARYFERSESERNAAMSFIGGHATITVNYRDLRTLPKCRSTIADVSAFLQLERPVEDCRSKTVKLSTVPLSNRITNYRELRGVFRDTRWSPFFD
jgi:hypothetical protein